MDYWYQWSQTVQQMHRKLVEQARQITDLEILMAALQREMNHYKEQKRIHIDKVEYKFDQLKVERLEGTLNIGLTPGALEDLAVNGSGASGGKVTGADEFDLSVQQGDELVEPEQALNSEVEWELEQYMDNEVPKQIEQLQTRYAQQLDSRHQKMVIEDLKRQMSSRIKYYFQQMSPGATAAQISSIKDSVLFRTKNDITAAIDNYFNKMAKKDAGES